MLAAQRQERLLQLVRAQGSVVVSEVARLLEVSELTVRRDVNTLAERGLVTRVHGGATLPDPQSPFAPHPGRPARRSGADSRFTVGMVVPSLNYYWPSILAGARAAAAESSVRLLLRSSSYDLRDDRNQIGMLLDTPGLDGLVLAPDVDDPGAEELLGWLDRLPLPVVLAERRAPASMLLGSLEWVGSDHVLGARLGVEHLHAEGHRRIGLLVAGGSPTSPHLRRGWEEQLRRHGLDPDEQLTGVSDGFVDPGRAHRMDAVLDEARRRGTTALLVHPDPAAVSLVQHCTDAGTRVPDDLAVVAYDDEVASLGEPAVTAVRPPKQHVGRLAVELMTARLTEGGRRPPHRISIGPELVVRGSSVLPGDGASEAAAEPATQTRRGGTEPSGHRR
ncbi:substrate-binding domain-containing protein [Desertihabitans aurantiacus]|uniref:substrate-binding domain-containing protein n=1 Tax=Desertihabitans aurantiacus TaxID=2282477 RepID=UPI000DF78375|nr:substrate-binding domain-containing protein [Desertihabitans aurantiacus]